jgi:hypothetical protein
VVEGEHELLKRWERVEEKCWDGATEAVVTQIKHLKTTQVSEAVAYHFSFQAVFTVVSHGNLNQERRKTR